MALPGSLQFGAYYILVFWGLKYTTVNAETLVSSFEGILMIGVAAMLGRPASLRIVLLGAASLFGLLMATWEGSIVSTFSGPGFFGNGLVFLANFVGCLYTVFTEKDLNNHRKCDPQFILALPQSAGLIAIAVFYCVVHFGKHVEVSNVLNPFVPMLGHLPMTALTGFFLHFRFCCI